MNPPSVGIWEKGPAKRRLRGLGLCHANLRWYHDDTVTIEVFGDEREPVRGQQNLRALEPVPEPPRGRFDALQRHQPVLDVDRDVAGDEPIELVETIVERLSLRGNVVFEALRAHPVAVLKYHYPHGNSRHGRPIFPGADGTRFGQLCGASRDG
jgi:hypothetical protein